MTKRTSKGHVVFLVALALTFLLTQRYVQHVRAAQRPYGRYTENQAIALATPIFHAILPNRDDLYVTTTHGEITGANGQNQRVWGVDCLDGNGDHLIHLARDADSGEVCRIGYDWRSDHGPSNPIILSSQQAAVEAQRWMRILGFNEEWKPVGAPEYRSHPNRFTDTDWYMTLQRSGWRAHLVINERAGTLVFVSLIPIH